jgi:hypothetical protein
MAESQPLSIKAFRLGSQQAIGHRAYGIVCSAEGSLQRVVVRGRSPESSRQAVPICLGPCGPGLKVGQ